MLQPRICIRLDPLAGLDTVCARLRHYFSKFCDRTGVNLGTRAAFLLFAVLPALLPAQEALRISLAGQSMAERRKYELSQQRFNVKLGPVAMRLSSNLGVEATDNVFATENNPRADLSVRPQMNLFSVWRVTEKNSLSLGLGLGYRKYVRTTEYDSLFISPDTDLSFDLYVGDFAINFHDRFDYSQDVSSDPTVSGTGSLNRFENTAGVQVIWDLNKALLTFGYDHRDFIAIKSQFEQLTHSAELFTTTAGFRLQPTLQVGLEVGGGFLDYQRQVLQDNQHIAAGPYVIAQVSEYTSVRLGGGYVFYSLDTYGNTALSSQTDAVYFDGSVRQRLGSLITHTLSFGRTVQSGIASDLVDVWRVQDTAMWNLLRKTSLSTTVSYEHAKTSTTQGETLDRYGFGVTLGHTLTKRMSGTLGYQFYLKNSDRANSDYLQNRLVLNLAYTF